MLDWVHAHEALMWWLAIGSAIAFVGTLLLVPWLVVRIPHDYFAPRKASPGPWAHRHPVIRGALVLGKNVLGVVFLLAGIAMLVLPGQGVLTILAGIMLLDFPGKRRLECWVVSRPAVLKSINWIRQRAGHQPLVVGPQPD
jgi:hypothetical protein